LRARNTHRHENQAIHNTGGDIYIHTELAPHTPTDQGRRGRGRRKARTAEREREEEEEERGAENERRGETKRSARARRTMERWG